MFHVCAMHACRLLSLTLFLPPIYGRPLCTCHVPEAKRFRMKQTDHIVLIKAHHSNGHDTRLVLLNKLSQFVLLVLTFPHLSDRL